MGCENLEAFLKRLTRKLRNSNVEVWPARQARVQPIPLLMPVYPTGSVYSSQAREEIGEHRRRGDTYDVAHFAMRARTRGNRWTGECKQTRRMSKLLSPMHPLFRFLCSSVPVLTLPPMPGPTQLSLADARTLSLSLSLSFSLRHFGSISMGSLDLLYLAYPAATIPHLHALIPVHTSERIRYGRAYRARATFTLHNAGVLCFFLCAATVTSFRECAERHTVLSP